ncbi:protein SHORT-ROOT 1-like [Zingiber officinale]|uniref:Uncharacterized protein n=1 Tax=Zingiber officinale TaxID=94328 RepID=A0A8J5F195_ZINOF|nr:protein SHORT-ROOT 1-like [Zingiber officinale]KAG6475883.1 hypothetical protein ZIOFF_065113 [Zingiber officinale]
MDTLFRLFSPQSNSHRQSSYDLSRNSSSSRSSGDPSLHQINGGYYLEQPDYSFPHQDPYSYRDQECGTNHHGLFMDEDFSSSSSSKHLGGHRPPATPTLVFDPAAAAADLNLDVFSSPISSSSASGSGGGGRWASQLLLECARAVAARDTQRAQQLTWMLNELASPYGDAEQKVAAYFLQGLFARLTASGQRTLRTLAAASDRNCSFDSARRTALRFQELSPWSSFGHVAANGAILEAFLEGTPQRLHILDLSTTFCTQWPTLLEALATRSADDTPHLTITTVAAASSSMQRVMKEIGQRMEKFARLMGVPFRFNVVHHAGDLSSLDLDTLDLRCDDSVSCLAVNCVNALHAISPNGGRRGGFLAAIRRLRPQIVTVVEEEADLAGVDGGDEPEEGEAFMKVFQESLRFFTAYMESLEESFPRTSNERLSLERTAGRAVVDIVSCAPSESAERREKAAVWSRRMRTAGFAPSAFSEDAADDVRALLRRYREGWSMRSSTTDADDAGVFLEWKEQAVVWASAWKP